MTAPAHVLVFRPIIQRLRDAGPRGRGHRARLRADARAARAARHGAHAVRPPRRRVAAAQAALAAVAHARDARASAAGAGFDLALAHGSNDLAIAARRLRIPAVNMFDYEFASLQHNIGCRLARRVITPDSIPPERLRRFGVGPEKLFQYPGLKEEYYLADFEPDPGVLDRLGLDREQRARGRAPAARRLALPPQVEPAVPAGADAPRHATRACRRSCCRAPTQQREYVRALELPSVIVPGARRRRPEPGRARRPRRLGRRDDEPRGRGARHAGLHDLRRSAWRRRRGADPRATACAR